MGRIDNGRLVTTWVSDGQVMMAQKYKYGDARTVQQVPFIRPDIELPDVMREMPEYLSDAGGNSAYDIHDPLLIESVMRMIEHKAEAVDFSSLRCRTLYYDGYYSHLHVLSLRIELIEDMDSSALYIRFPATKYGEAVLIIEEDVRRPILDIFQTRDAVKPSGE